MSRSPEAECDLETSPAEVLAMARERFNWPAEDREPPIPRAPKGRDPFVYGRSNPR